MVLEKKKYFIKKISDYAMVGGLGAILVTSFTACEDKGSNNQNGNSSAITQASQKQGAFVIVEKVGETYKIVDEFPATNTTIVLREDGKERILTKEEIDKLVAQEAQKIDNGTSNLTNPNSMGGMSLGETLLASAAGAIIGSYIGNKLFNNPNYQTQRRTTYKSPQTYSKSVDSFKKTNSTTSKTTAPTQSNTNKKTGFFSNSSPKKKSSISFGG